MGNALIGWVNHVVTGSLLYSDQLPSLPAVNLQNDQGSADQGWQTPDGVTTASLIVDFGYTGPVRLFSLHGTNLSIAARLRWRVWQHASMLDDSLAWDTAWAPPPDRGVAAGSPDDELKSAGVAPFYNQSITCAPLDPHGAPPIGRYVRLDLRDAFNPQGFLNVSLAFVGPAWQPRVNLSWASAQGRDDQVAEAVSFGGQEWPQFQWSRRAYDLALAGIRSDEVWSRAMDLDRAARAGGNVLVVPNPDDPDVGRAAVFGRFKPTGRLGYAQTSPDARSYAATVTQRL